MNDPYSNPWRTLSSRAIYENPWIAIREDQVVRPDGQPGIYGVVHMQNKAIGVLPVDDEENVYLVGQFRYTLDEYSWEIPEGGCPAGEDPLVAAQRELREETGLVAQNWQPIGRSHLSNSVTDEEAFLFLATGLSQGQAEPEGTEELQMRRLPFNEALQMALNGENTDCLSVLALFRYALLREDQAR